MAGYVVGIDLGGTKILTARVGVQGEIEAQVRELTHATEGSTAVIDRMVNTVARVLEDADPAGLIGVGVGAPGPLDPKTGVLYSPPNLPGWERVPLRDILSERLAVRLGRSVRVEAENDANAAALGEYRFGVRRQHPTLRHMVYITVSTGIGGGLIADGRIFEGAHGMAAEIGHMTVDMHGPRCNCGNIGCIEIVASGTALAHEAAMVVRSRKPTGLYDAVEGDPSKITVETVVKVAQEGDPTAQALIQHEGMLIGVGAVNCIHTFNPELVVIGGGVSNSGELLFESIRSTVADRVMPAYEGTYTIAKAALGGDAGALGAVAGVIDHLQSTQRLA